MYFTDTTLSDHWGVFLLTIIGSTFVIAGSLVLNNWYEVDLDREMTSTKERPTVTVNITLKLVLRIGVLTSIIGLTILLFTTIEATVYAFLGWFTYVVLYTFWSKRRYTLNTVIGSVSGAFTPLIGWAAIDSAFHIVPMTLFLLLFICQIPHTFSMAIMRYNVYQTARLPQLHVLD